mmetsp:Transcript_15416/g.17116  ORF Transcript_15416/g.17116 Transcript_15416/m.17116 type:complete len:225 (-) Transcript_15416:110-784(-)
MVKQKKESGMFGEHWSQSFTNALDRNEKMKSAIDDVELSQSYTGKAGVRLRMASKLIRARKARNVNRDAIHIKLGGFDTHSGMRDSLDVTLEDLNSGLDSFTKEMEDLGLSSNVTVIVGSEFGRTFTPNTDGGTDHAWGGNYFMLGGAVKGGKIVGKYPNSFADNDPTSCGRGRLIPSQPWDALWNGVAQWFGITDEESLNYILPNRLNFPPSDLFQHDDLFES